MRSNNEWRQFRRYPTKLSKYRNFSQASTSVRRKCALKGPGFWGGLRHFRRVDGTRTSRRKTWVGLAKNDENIIGVRHLVLDKINIVQPFIEFRPLIRRANVRNTRVLRRDHAPSHTAISIYRFSGTENIPEAPDSSPFLLISKIKNSP